MAYINVAVSNHGTESQYTTGKVTLVKEKTTLPLYSVYDEEKKQAIPLKLNRCGKYELVIHIFTNNKDEDMEYFVGYNHGDIIRIQEREEKDMAPLYGEWTEGYYYLFTRRETTLEFKALSKNRSGTDCEFFIDVHYRS